MGVLRNYKGLQFLVEAMRGVSNYNLIIAGGGPCYDELKTLIEHYQLTNIQLLGRVTEEKNMYFIKTLMVSYQAHIYVMRRIVTC